MGKQKKSKGTRSGKYAQGRNRGIRQSDVSPAAALRRHRGTRPTPQSDLPVAAAPAYRRDQDPSIDPPSTPLTPQSNRLRTVPGTPGYIGSR